MPKHWATGRTSIVARSAGAACVLYIVAGAVESSLISIFRPSERALAWVSDVVLSGALGVAVYLWLHLRATRQALLDRERAELVLNTQLAIAADMQRRLLPTLPIQDGPLDWAAALKSAGQIGGDFYDLVPLADGRVLLLVVTGPGGTRTLESLGPPAALLPGVAYLEATVALSPGDVCVFVSDGVTEALGDAATQQLGQLAQAQMMPGCAAHVCRAVMSAALEGRGPDGVQDWDDDRTVVVLAVR